MIYTQKNDDIIPQIYVAIEPNVYIILQLELTISL